MSREEELEKKLKEVTSERNHYHAQLTDLLLKQLRDDVDDHEKRIRIIEPIIIRSNILFALTTGGGLLSAIVLIREFAGLLP